MNHLLNAALLALFITGAASAQQKEKQKVSQDVIIKKNGKSDEKMTIVIDGDKVTINGKPVTEFNDNEIIIRKKDLEDELAKLSEDVQRVKVYGKGPESFNFDFNVDPDFGDQFAKGFENIRIYSDGKPQPILGVVTEKAEKGLKLTDISEGSAAEKAGLKEGDVLTKFAGTPVSDPDKLRELVRARKPGEEVEISYIKAGEKKEKKVKVTLGSYQPEARAYNMTPGGPRSPRPPRAPQAPHPPMDNEFFIEAPHPPMPPGPPSEDMMRAYRYRGDRVFVEGPQGRPQLGVRIQDTDDSSGVKVLDVYDGSLAATAGVKESDIIVNIDGKRVKDAEDAREAIDAAREKTSYPLVINRGGQVMNIEIKVPRKLKKTDL